MKTAAIVVSLMFLCTATANAANSSPERPPWDGQYKIKPEETDRLTPADVVGPDGIVYPNWTKTGVQGGIPDIDVVVRIDDFGGKADDDRDDSEALDAACRAAGEKGGGAVALDKGTYYLDLPVTVGHDGVVIRGAGAGQTRIVFRYALPEKGIRFYWPPAGGRIGSGTRIELHAIPKDLQKMNIRVGDREVGSWNRGQHSGNTFSFSVPGSRVVGPVKSGKQELQGIAEYSDGAKRTVTIPVVVDPDYREPKPPADTVGAITFKGTGLVGPEHKLAKDGKRGDMMIELENAGDLKRGDCVLIDGPATKRWKTLTQCVCQWGMYRMYMAVVEKVDGNSITLNQPLRIGFPTIDGSYVRKVEPIRRCGIEHLTIEQTENLWISSVIFSHGWNCWARGVTAKMCGRYPVYGLYAKWCEIRDCVFDDAWFKGGGGTAYGGWQTSWDCLMEDVETFKLRHAPLVQWASSGNVIRKSVFHESDGQWHAGWTNENLFEQCVIESVRGNGGYGYGLWGSPPGDAAHGPNGPRNVVYNCEVQSPKAGCLMGGMNENWLILYNQFVVDSGPGVTAQTASFDHIIKDNLFVLRDGKSPMIQLGSRDCIGVEIVGNRLFGGSGRFLAGPATPALLEDNHAFALGAVPTRPEPKVPSIYEWQQRHARE